MDDFQYATILEEKEKNRWRANVYEDWALWGPAGGYLTALALRAAGEATSFDRPASLSCQFLNIAKFEPLDITVCSLRQGKRSEALRVELTQGDKLILTALIWAKNGEPAESMMQHDYCGVRQIPRPENLRTIAELYPDRKQLPFMARMQQCPIDLAPAEDLTPREPQIRNLFRWVDGATSDDPFIDGGRMMMFMDTYAWLATYAAHPVNGPSPYIAPNLDYYYQFHRPTGEHEWIYLQNRADLACDSLIATQGEIRTLEGEILVRGYAQLLCSHRPQQFK